MKDTLDQELNRFDTENRFLFMDPSAEKVSFTSDKNPEPETLQVVLRTQEISLEDEEHQVMDAETKKNRGQSIPADVECAGADLAGDCGDFPGEVRENGQRFPRHC